MRNIIKNVFNFDKYKYNHNANPISFSTNGYSVCINFELPNDIPIKRCKEKYSQKYKLNNINNIENIKKILIILLLIIVILNI